MIHGKVAYFQFYVDDLIQAIKDQSHTCELKRRRSEDVGSIVGKKWDPGILDPSRFSHILAGKLGKLSQIRKIHWEH